MFFQAFLQNGFLKQIVPGKHPPLIIYSDRSPHGESSLPSKVRPHNDPYGYYYYYRYYSYGESPKDGKGNPALNSPNNGTAVPNEATRISQDQQEPVSTTKGPPVT